MTSSRLRTFARVAIAAALTLLVACSTDNPVFTPGDGGADAAGEIDAPAGTVPLTIVRDGTSTGTVTSNPGGIACGTTCTAYFPPSTMVTLFASADSGAQFAGWSGGCTGTSASCSVTVEAATSVTATFNTASLPVEVLVGGAGGGLVTSTPAGIMCPDMCQTTVPYNGMITLSASPMAGSLFLGWSGGGCTGTGQCVATITAATTINATFARNGSLEVTKTGNGSGTVASAPTGINCGVDCSEQYTPGTSVTLTATPAADSLFTGWSGGGCSGTSTCTVTVSDAILVTANFVLKRYTLTAAKTGLGSGSVTSNPAGITCGANCAAQFDAGQSVTLTAAPTGGSIFAGWSGGGCTGIGTCVVTLAADTTVTASFSPVLHTLTVTRSGGGAGSVTSSPVGINCGNDCNEDFPQGAMITLTAMPNSGSTFSGWSGGCTGTATTCVVTLATATTVNAAFAGVTHTLTAAKTGPGTGTVTSSPTGINCGADCSEAYAAGTGVILSASAGPGSTFTGWSGGGCAGTGTCSVTLNAPTTVTATFGLQNYTLTVSKTGTGAGTVTSSPAGISCGATCSTSVAYNTMVTLTAAPTTGSTFGGWSGGGCSGTALTCTTTVTAAATVTATFTLNQYTLTVSNGGNGTIASSPAGISCGATCNAMFGHGTVITLSATPNGGYNFAGWSGGGCSGTGSCAVTLTGPTTVSGSFSVATSSVSVTKTGTGAGTVTSTPAGINCGADCNETYASGTTVTLAAVASTGSTFAGWSGGGCSGTAGCTVTVGTTAIAVTATFTLNQYTLTAAKNGTGTGTVTSSVGGINCGATCSATIGHGTAVTLSQSPSAGSVFSGWSGGGCSGTGTCTTTVTANTTVTATFTLNQYPLTVSKSGSGTVTSSPAGINCGGTCSANFNHGTTVSLSATAGAGHTFAGWGGACSGTGTCSVSMTSPQSVSATFSLNNYTLTVNRTGSGTVTSSVGGINCGGTCTASLPYGTTVNLSQAPGGGYNFAGWSGACSGTGACSLTITGNTTVGATFDPAQYTLSVTRSGAGNGSVTSAPAGINCASGTCNATYAHGTTVTLTANVGPGSTFAGWAGACTGTTATCTVSMTAAQSVTAQFDLRSYTLYVDRLGNGRVVSSPAGINCGGGSTQCTATFLYGTAVNVSAFTTDFRWQFQSFEGDCAGSFGECDLVMDTDKSVTAYFQYCNPDCVLPK
jgi:uncharacterized repeat protein (TIGR02543 family)